MNMRGCYVVKIFQNAEFVVKWKTWFCVGRFLGRFTCKMVGFYAISVFSKCYISSIQTILAGYSTVKTKDRGITETSPQLAIKGVG